MTYSMVRGRVIRLTALSRCGDLSVGADYVTSKAVTSVTPTESTYAHRGGAEATSDTDEVRFVHEESEETIGFGVDITMLNVDPDVIKIVSGNPSILDVAGNRVGFGVQAGVRAPSFALEVWTKLAGARCTSNEWGYTLFPFLKGGRVSMGPIANGLTTITLSGARCRRGNKWGTGVVPENGFGLDPLGLTPFGGGVNPGGYGVGPFGETPFDSTDTPGVNLTPYNQFWVQTLVNGHPGPGRRILTPAST